MKSLLLLPLIAVIVSPARIDTDVEHYPNNYYSDDDIEWNEMDMVVSEEETTDEPEPLNTLFDMPGSRMLNFEDGKEHHEIELRNTKNTTTVQPSGDCESNGGECKKNTKQCKDTISTDYTCSKNGICCIVEVKAKGASELMLKMLSNVILIQRMAFQTMKDNQENSMNNLTKTIANQKMTIDSMNSNLSNAISDQVIALQILKRNLSDTISNQGMALQIKQDSIMSNLSDGFSNQENMLQLLEDNQENIMSNLTHLGCPNGFFQLSPSSQCFKLFIDQTRTWYEAKTKCQTEGLVSAKPSDPVELQKYIVNTYGNNIPSKGNINIWLPAQGTGSSTFQWYPNGGIIYSSNPYWYSTSASSYSSTSYCMAMMNYDSWMKSYPGKPYYYAYSCGTRLYTICELVKE